MTRAWEVWSAWWFGPVDARVLAAMRISLGLLLLHWWAQLGSDLPALFADEGLVGPRALVRDWTTTRWSHLDHLSPRGLYAAHVAGAVAIAAFTLGVGTRLTNVVVAALLIGLHHRNPWIQNGGDRLLRLWALYLCLTPSGAAWSVDAWVRRWRGLPAVTEVPIFGLRLVQLQVGWMYLDTGVEKVLGTGWTDGTAIHWALSDGNFNRAPWLYDPLLYSWPGQVWAAVTTYLTLGWELLFVPMVIWPRTRTAALVLGVGLHLGILATMSVGVFGPASVWGYQAFLWDRWPRPGPAHPAGRR